MWQICRSCARLPSNGSQATKCMKNGGYLERFYSQGGKDDCGDKKVTEPKDCKPRKDSCGDDGSPKVVHCVDITRNKTTCDEHDGKGTIYMAIFFFVCLPLIIAQSLNIFVFNKCEPVRPKFIPYEYMRMRTKSPNFWRGGTQEPFFYNPKVNALPDGYADGGDGEGVSSSYCPGFDCEE